MPYDITKIDWVKYLERETPLIFFAGIMRPYGALLVEATNGEFRLTHQFRVFAGTGGTLYLSAAEMKAADDFFEHLIINNDPRLTLWYNKGHECTKRIEAILQRFENFSETLEFSEIQSIYHQYEQYLLYNIIIPFRILSAVDRELAKESILPNSFEKAKDMFQHFRAGSLYPVMLRQVFPHFYTVAEEKSGIPRELGSYMTPDELFAVLESKSIVTAEELENRKTGCAFWENPQTGEIEFSFKKDILQELGLEENTTDITELRGGVAFPGKVTGRVKIVNNDQELNKVEEGDIIVSFNTNPSLMPALLKCAAMVTNEGGIMCHAAIVSRELKKPCVIGTKIATKIFKDGDLVEVDADNGIVRKI